MPGFIFALFLFIVLLLAIYAVIIFNGFQYRRQQVQRAWSNIEVLLKQRRDEITNLVSLAQGYIAHETELLTRISEIRAREQAGVKQDKLAVPEASRALSQAIQAIFAISEGYPELKAHNQFASVEARITELEELIALRREHYNHTVMIYNLRADLFPDRLMAELLGTEPWPYFDDPSLSLQDGSQP